MLAIVYRGIAIPIHWTLLNKRGNSDTKERIAALPDRPRLPRQDRQRGQRGEVDGGFRKDQRARWGHAGLAGWQASVGAALAAMDLRNMRSRLKPILRGVTSMSLWLRTTSSNPSPHTAVRPARHSH